MPQFARRYISTAILGLCALFTLAFTPAINPTPGTQTEQSGRCLEGYAYAETTLGNHGITSIWCIKPTNCNESVFVGPASVNGGVANLHYYVLVPRPVYPDLACYV